jgi:tRNA modification GTPase
VFSVSDTIVAIATAPVRAGLGVVRLSGPCAPAVAREILSLTRDLEPRVATFTHARLPRSRATAPPLNPDAAHQPERRAAAWGNGAIDADGPATQGPVIDQVVVTWFPGPRSYTAEDVVEIGAHGSMAVLRAILAAAIEAGARLAEPGEFTLRAYLNGRLDLVQAEAVGDLVNAVTPLQARVAFDQLDGSLTRAIGVIDAAVFDLAARLEASVDFPDEGYHFVARSEAEEAITRAIGRVDALLATAARGRVIREGRRIAILGRPNVGKSSLFNALLGAERAIVSAEPGTTRDVVSDAIDLDGVRVELVDTAGIRPSEDAVEREGVARARRAAEVADVVVVVLDQSRPLVAGDRALVEEAMRAPRVVVVNKTDLPSAWDMAALGFPAALRVSLKSGAGVADVRAALVGALEIHAPEHDAPLVSNLRHEALLWTARESLARAGDNLRQAGEGASEEWVLADLAGARGALEEIAGKRTAEDVLRRIFERFCVGK